MILEEPSLKNSCREFLQSVLSETAPEIQRTEMTNAFYAGVYTAFGFYKSVFAVGVSEERGVEILVSLGKEIDRWKDEMVARAKDGRPHPKLDEIP